MDRRIVAAFAILAAIAIAAVGYSVGVRTAGLTVDQRAAIEAIVKDTLSAEAPLTPAPGQGWLPFVWIALGLVGTAVQLGVTGKKRKQP